MEIVKGGVLDNIERMKADLAKAKGISAVFEIEASTVEETLRWARDVAGLDVEQLRSSLVTAGKACDSCLSLSEYYLDNLEDCSQSIIEGKGDPVINKKRLHLLEEADKVNNLSGYLTLLQMDATMSLINLMEARTDSERLLTCKHAYTILYEAIKTDLFRVISKTMREIPDELLPNEDRVLIWKDVKGLIRMMISEEEAERVRNNIDAHKSASFIEQIAAFSQCDFKVCFANIYALMRLALMLQRPLSAVRENISKMEDEFVVEIKDRIKMWDALQGS